MAKRDGSLESAVAQREVFTGAAAHESISALLRELVALLRQNRTQLREEWARRITEAQLLTAMSKDEIFESVERFYHRYYLRPKPILRIIKTMLEDKDIMVRRCREGYEFFKSLRQRKADLAAAQAVAA